MLFTFFITSSALSWLLPDPAASRLDAKGAERDQWQVLANGGAAAVGALAEFWLPGSGLWLLTSTLAAAAADTWATSLGARSTSPPRDILSRRVVAAGTSGGVTFAGTLGGAAGAVTVGLVGTIATGRVVLFPVSVFIGILAMLADSALGAAWQGKFYCDRCALPTERRIHRCGGPARHTGGRAWLTNDGVNLIATTLALAAAFGAWRWCSPS